MYETSFFYYSDKLPSSQLSAPFWSTLSLSGPSGDFKVDLAPTDKTFIYRNSQLLTFEAEEVARCLREGQ